MATGTDDKDTGGEAAAPHSTETSLVGHDGAAASEAIARADGEADAASDHRPQSVWTASDARGPLEKADDDHLPPAAEEEPVGLSERGATASASSEASSSAHTAPERRSAWPIAAGIVVGALIGAGAALLASSQGLMNNQSGASDAQVAALSSKIDALEKRPVANGDVKGLETRVSALSAKVDDLAKRPTAAAAPVADTAKSSDLDALKRDVGSLQASVDALKSQTSAASTTDHGTDEKVAALSSELAGLKSAASQNQASLASVKDDQKRLSDKVAVPAFAAAADSLVRQVGQGEPYAPQLDALTSLGADPAKLAILRQNAGQGVPSSKVLAQKFEPLAEPITATTQKVPANAGFVDRLKSGMLNMVSIRSVDDTSGTDLPSRVARIKLDLAHDDVADAVATWDALPPDAKAKSDAWAALARSSAEAIAAARALQHDSIIALSAKKS